MQNLPIHLSENLCSKMFCFRPRLWNEKESFPVAVTGNYVVMFLKHLEMVKQNFPNYANTPANLKFPP